MILSVQLDVLAGAAQHSAFRGRGLLSSFICLRPKSLVGHRKPTTPVPPRIIARYNLAVRTLLNYPETAAGNRGLGPHPIRLDDASQELWLQFGKRTEYALREGEQLAEMRDWGGKPPGQVLRIAGLCHLTMHAQPHQHRITSATMQAVIDLAEQLTEHTRATYALMWVDETVECAKAILRCLAQDRPLSFTARSAYEKVKGRWPKMDRINASLIELEARGSSRWTSSPCMAVAALLAPITSPPASAQTSPHHSTLPKDSRTKFTASRRCLKNTNISFNSHRGTGHTYEEKILKSYVTQDEYNEISNNAERTSLLYLYVYPKGMPRIPTPYI